jgi:hypothetical protein
MIHQIRRFPLIVGAATVLLVSVAPSGRARAQATLRERLGSYRIMDASGRITPRTPVVADGQGRVALRPAYPPPLLLRGRPSYLAGYAGTYYGPGRPHRPSLAERRPDGLLSRLRRAGRN